MGKSPDYDKAGRFHLENFDIQEIGGHPQNWAATQCEDGLIYIGSSVGLLEYDGVDWRYITIPGESVVRTVVTADDGTVYVGTLDDFGYLAPDSIGQASYVSLLEHVPETSREFGEIWGILLTDDGVWFHSRDRLMRWAEQDTVTSWEPESQFLGAFAVDDEVYVSDSDVGLLRLTDADSLQLLPDGELFADKRVVTILPLAPGELLVGTMHAGLFHMREGGIVPFECEVNSFVIEHQLYKGLALPDGTLALGTLRQGLVIVDQDGGIMHVFDKSSGLRNDVVLGLAMDKQEGLWICFDDGAARIELQSPLTYFNEENGLKGSVSAIAMHKNRMWVGTGWGVFVSYLKKGEAGGFRLLDVIKDQIWTLESSREGLIMGATSGVHLLMDDELETLDPDVTCYQFQRDPADSNIVWIGTDEGIGYLRREAGTWSYGGQLPNIEGVVRSLTADQKGRLLLSFQDGGVMRVTLGDEPTGEPETIETYGPDDGIPGTWSTNFFDVNGHVALGSQRGILRFATELELAAGSTPILPDSTFGVMYCDSTSDVSHLVQNAAGDAWMYYGMELGIARKQEDGSYIWDPKPLNRMPKINATVLMLENDSILWNGNFQGITRLDTRIERDYTLPFNTVVRNVTSIGDSLLHGGLHGEGIQDLVLSHEENALRVEFAGLSYDGLKKNQYQYYLEGFDKRWSHWSDETKKDYTNLRGGKYVFHVRAKNAYGQESETGSLPFWVEHPWYESWWAYTMWACLLIGVIYITGARLNRYRLQRLEGRVRERTAQLNETVAELKLATAKAEAATKAKSEFLATMSHEIRTPMNGVMGMTAIVMETPLSPRQRDCMEIIRSSGETLLTVINDILDFSKIEAGKLLLERHAFDIQECIDDALDIIALRVGEKDIELTTLIDPSLPRRFRGDPTRLRQILVNILSNAVKFTNEGEICVLVKGEVRPDGDYLLQLSIQDTGIGIPKRKQIKLFKAFSQVDSSTTRRFGGTGLGLAICKRLAQLMGGEIWVESETNTGSTFHFTVVCPAIEEPAAPKESSLIGKRVLILDDNANVRRSLENYTKAWGLKPTLSRYGTEAMDIAEQEAPFDLALIDLKLGDMDGLTVAERLASIPEKKPPTMILLSSIDDDVEIDNSPFFADLSKPVRISALRKMVVDAFKSAPSKPPPADVMESEDLDDLGRRLPRRILLAEDNAINQKVAISMLRKIGYTADVAENGMMALDACGKATYDIVLMDMQMPEMDGLEATRRLRDELEDDKQPYIIAMTANAMKGDKERCIEAGMDDYVSKPVSIDLLAAAIKRSSLKPVPTP